MKPSESPFSEVDELELATELLEVTSDQELDQFLGRLLHRAVPTGGVALAPSLGRQLGGLAKGAVHKILPAVGRAFDASLEPGAHGQVGQLAAGADHLLGLESEGLSAEDQELNAATQLVRLAGTAATWAAARGSAGSPEALARHAMTAAARIHTPGLVQASRERKHGCGCTGGHCSCHATASGRWRRRGRRIVLHGF